MSGRRIDDHGFWVGGKKAGVPLPMESKMKEERSAGGVEREGSLDYPDTTEKIYRDQEHGMKKAKAHPQKAGYRN